MICCCNRSFMAFCRSNADEVVVAVEDMLLAVLLFTVIQDDGRLVVISSPVDMASPNEPNDDDFRTRGWGSIPRILAVPGNGNWIDLSGKASEKSVNDDNE